jgi:dephospho-CoA kinase
MKLYGLTGGIACGKSTVGRVLSEEHGAYIIDCDLIVRELQRPDSPCVRAIARAFREDDVVDPETGELDRKKLGAVVFADPSKRRTLAGIMNGPTIITILKRIAWAFLTQPWNGLVLIDAPLLFETGFLVPLCSKIIVLSCSPAVQVERMVARDGLDQVAAERRIAAQMPIAVKEARADRVIRNEGLTLEQLRDRVRECALWMKRTPTWHSGANRIAVLLATVITLVGVVAVRALRRA